MSELDLDALERDVNAAAFDFEGSPDAITAPLAEKFLALIQRLREAEAEVKRQGDIADKALEGWNHDQTEWFKVAERNRQLERVCEAANQINSAIITHDLIDGGDVTELRAALAAMEEK